MMILFMKKTTVTCNSVMTCTFSSIVNQHQDGVYPPPTNPPDTRLTTSGREIVNNVENAFVFVHDLHFITP